MLSTNNNKSIINHLSTDKNSQIILLAQKHYNEYLGILYVDKKEQNDALVHFSYYKKHPLYKKRYKFCGQTSTSSGVNFIRILNENSNEFEYFIFNGKSNRKNISIFEFQNGEPIKKLEEIHVDNNPYIIVRQYDLENNDNEILTFEGSYSLQEILAFC